MLLGVQMQMMIGPAVPVPAPLAFVEALQDVQVTHSEAGRSVFQITFRIGRRGPVDLDYSLVGNPLLEPRNRVVLTVVFNGVPHVLSDGIITQRTINSSTTPGQSTISITGEDISLMMDLVQVRRPHAAQDEATRVRALLGTYSALLGGMPPIVIQPTSVDVPSPSAEVPSQASTDLEYIKLLGQRFNHEFFVKPGPAPLQNTAYWGPLPPPTSVIPQRVPLSVNMGPFSNVESLNFTHDALAPFAVLDTVPGEGNRSLPLVVPARVPHGRPLAARPAVPMRTELAHGSEGGESQAGVGYARAVVRAQSRVNRSHERTLTVRGEIESVRYGSLLHPRSLVNVRGAGLSNDGQYYVREVTHTLSVGSYKQSFSLSREGTTSTTPGVAGP